VYDWFTEGFDTPDLRNSRHEKREIKVGDVVHIKADERQRHGAKADTTMEHITITLVGSQAAHG
jgi:quercetin dioxygenase-like cupin family protein